MPKRRSLSYRQADVSDVLGVFALPNVVLFPEATLPLHIFEPRYRALVSDSLQGERVFAMALLKPGHEDGHENAPAIHPIGCAGRIEDVLPLPDGRYLLTLTGTQRVEFGEMTRARPYRCHKVRYLEEATPGQDDHARDTLIRLLSAYQQIAAAISGQSPAIPLVTEVPFARTVNRIAFSLEIDIALKYALIENGNLSRRAERLVALLEEALPHYLSAHPITVN